MDLILLNKDFEEIGPVYVMADVEIGDKNARNDFEILSGKVSGYGFYIPNTEVGGIFEYKSTIYGENPMIRGYTWRGLLTQGIIEPQAGEDYRIVSGDANEIIKELLEDYLGGFYSVPNEESGLFISDYQFPLYCNYLEGIMDMLEANNYRLKITAKKSNTLKKVNVYAEAVPIQVLEGEYNEDSSVKLQLIENNMGINHLICLGKGELKDRQRIDLYMGSDGKVGMIPYFTGFQERTDVFEYSNAQSYTELVEYGTRRLLETASQKNLKIVEESKDLEIGDIVRGRHIKTQISVEAPICKKIYRVKGENVTVEYKIKEDM